MSAVLSTPAAFPAPVIATTSGPPEALTIEAADGCPLAVRYYRPTTLPAKGAVLIVPAMGVPQRFYQAFATWLAATGRHVLTFDFRGSGLSRKAPLRHERADILTWAEQDAAAALAALARRAPGLPITWVGHSLGGQIVPLVPGHGAVAKVITVATGSGYWRENAPSLKKKVWLLWFGLVPVLTPLFGYFPGKRLGMVGDLPKGVIQQWRRWCLNPEYLVGVEPGMRERYADFAIPVTSISFSDDEMMSKANIASIHGFYSGARRTMLRFHPRELGVEKVGHFGFFRKEMQAPIWDAKVLPELA